MKVRTVDVNSTSYKVAAEYMIRLSRADLEDASMLERLADAAKMTPDDFRDRFGYLAS